MVELESALKARYMNNPRALAVLEELLHPPPQVEEEEDEEGSISKGKSDSGPDESGQGEEQEKQKEQEEKEDERDERDDSGEEEDKARLGDGNDPHQDDIAPIFSSVKRQLVQR